SPRSTAWANAGRTSRTTGRRARRRRSPEPRRDRRRLEFRRERGWKRQRGDWSRDQSYVLRSLHVCGPLGEADDDGTGTGHVRGADAGKGLAFPDLDADPTQFLGGAEAVLVGGVVPKEYGQAAGKGGLLHEGADGVGLAGRCRASLDDHLALEQFEARYGVKGGSHRGAAGIGQFGRLPIVKGHRGGLALEEQNGMLLDRVLQLHGDCSGA